MTENLKTLEQTLAESVGGNCYFPERFNLPINHGQMKIKKKVNGGLGENRRFKNLIKSLIKSGQLTENQGKEKWAKIR